MPVAIGEITRLWCIRETVLVGSLWGIGSALYDSGMARKDEQNQSPRINNRRALHDYHIEAKLECGIALQGTEVKALRLGHASFTRRLRRVENGELWLYGLHIDPYRQAAAMYNHQPERSRKLLAHRREIKKLADATKEKGMTLVPLSIYFKDGRAKLELAVAHGKQSHDKRGVDQEEGNGPRSAANDDPAAIGDVN